MQPNYNPDKLKESLIHFVLRHSGRVTRTKLLKLVYLADVRSYQQRQRTITGLEYLSYDHGPWSPVFHRVLDQIPEIGEKAGFTPFGDIEYRYEGTVPHYVPQALSLEEIADLKETDSRWGGKSLREILHHVYTTPPFVGTPYGDVVDFEKLFANRKDR